MRCSYHNKCKLIFSSAFYKLLVKLLLRAFNKLEAKTFVDEKEEIIFKVREQVFFFVFNQLHGKQKIFSIKAKLSDMRKVKVFFKNISR